MKKIFLSIVLVVLLAICMVNYFSPVALASSASCESGSCQCSCSGSSSEVCSCTAGNDACTCICGTSMTSCGDIKVDQMQ